MQLALKIGVRSPGVQLLHAAKYFCDEANGDVAHDGTLMYLDQHHIHHQGSAYLAKRLLTENPRLLKGDISAKVAKPTKMRLASESATVDVNEQAYAQYVQ